MARLQIFKLLQKTAGQTLGQAKNRVKLMCIKHRSCHRSCRQESPSDAKRQQDLTSPCPQTKDTVSVLRIDAAKIMPWCAAPFLCWFCLLVVDKMLLVLRCSRLEWSSLPLPQGLRLLLCPLFWVGPVWLSWKVLLMQDWLQLHWMRPLWHVLQWMQVAQLLLMMIAQLSASLSSLLVVWFLLCALHSWLGMPCLHFVLPPSGLSRLVLCFLRALACYLSVVGSSAPLVGWQQQVTDLQPALTSLVSSLRTRQYEHAHLHTAGPEHDEQCGSLKT